ncbi:MAG: ABC transporter substrate-binding protein [bacterium]|nr:ABC transporter substrate-binding protein [bacterium]
MNEKYFKRKKSATLRTLGISKILKLVIIAILVIVVIASAVGIYLITTPTAPTTPTTTPVTPVVQKKTIRVLFAFPVQTDPGLAIDWASLRAVNNIYDSLIQLGSTGEPDPRLSIAEKWEVTPDGLTWTFHLKKGVTFHSGRTLTAKDVVFSLERLLKMGLGPAFVFAPFVESFKAIDDYTVQIKLKKTYGPFIYSLTLLYILDSEEVKKNIKPTGEYGDLGDYGKEWLRAHDAGSGPYKIKEHVFGEKLILERFEKYWGEVNPRAPDEVVLIPPPEPAAQVSLFLTGEIDITYGLPIETIIENMKRDGVGASKLLYGQQFLFVLNTQKPPLDDVHFRRALAYAFDYDKAVGAYVPGYAWKSIGPVANYLPGAPKDLPTYEKDLSKAREEIKKSKYYGKLSEYPIELWWCAEDPYQEKIVLIFVTSMKELDPEIRIDVVKKPWSAMAEATAKIESTPHIMILLSTPIFPETGNVLHLKFHSEYAGKSLIHISWLLNPEMDRLIDDALTTVDEATRFSKYKEIVKRLNDIVPEIPAFDFAYTVLYWKHYINWPAGEGKPPYGVQYNYNFRFMEVYPEKKAELFK